MICPTGRPPRRPGAICGGRSRPGCRWTTTDSTRPRWCTGVNGWPSRIGRTGSTRRCAGSSRRPGSCVAAANARWIPRSWPTRSPPRTPSPSWSRRSGGSGGSCLVAPRRLRRCAPGTTTAAPASRRSTGTSPAARTRWSRPWSTTRTRCWRRSPGSMRTRTGSRWPRRWHCWRWSPGRMSNPPKGPMAPMAGGASPAGSPPIG